MPPGDGGAAAGGEPPRVLLDAMCGKLATYLRMCGYDAAYALDRGAEADDRILSLAAAEDRTLITRDRQLAARADGAILLTERDVLDQLREVAEAGLPVELAAEPTRCGACNGPVERVGPAGAAVGPDERPEYVPDDVGSSPACDASGDDHDADSRPAWRCRDCGRWFWKGSHWASVAERLDAV
ncbi:Mut7-C RNAse domain-containing protein [Halorubrum kocurii]|uniref:Mut7-C RNAse domain-containing protein n=1 Tax=Halorubrum kocurii JCM 14978 TaxID=1230456 RepID=M0NVL7_9EURY|nr:Mut7-C RNAse domain-containing protein [Halorubrum kocurii]EMA61856.1 hypothetical protein C468_11670 [Halorubrum kocurii JCM 14978]